MTSLLRYTAPISQKPFVTEWVDDVARLGKTNESSDAMG